MCVTRYIHTYLLGASYNDEVGSGARFGSWKPIHPSSIYPSQSLRADLIASFASRLLNRPLVARLHSAQACDNSPAPSKCAPVRFVDGCRYVYNPVSRS